MRIWYHDKHGKISVEKINKSFFLIEESDGYHLDDINGVFHDKNGIYDSRMLYFQDQISPFGLLQTKQNMNKLINLIEMTKKKAGHISISKIASRMFDKIMEKLPYIILIIVMIGAFYIWAKGGI
jgi:hypothetical protein